jgi:hypothetical protein
MPGVTRTTAVRLGVAVVALAGVGFAAWAVWPRSAPAPVWADEYDVTAYTPETIAPGTVVGRSAPKGWSHLVIKSLPRVRPADREKLIGLTARMASWMFTAFVADVRPEKHESVTRYRLRAIGLGLGTSVGGRDTIVTPETAERHGVELNFISREILTKGYKTQALAVVVVHGPTFALVDTPVWHRCGDRNRLIRFRYALLVDAASGRLDVVCWSLDREGECGEPGVLVILAPDTIDEAELIPDTSRFTAGITKDDDAFGVEGLPPHKARLLLPPDLRPLASQVKYAPAEAADLEARLRRLIEPHK